MRSHKKSAISKQGILVQKASKSDKKTVSVTDDQNFTLSFNNLKQKVCTI